MANLPPVMMEEDLAHLSIEDEEEEELVVEQIDKEAKEDEFLLCLVGRALTNGALHFPSLKNILAEIWHPIEGVTITELEGKRILFRFYK